MEGESKRDKESEAMHWNVWRLVSPGDLERIFISNVKQ
jgi:hypothetical protein